MRPQHLHCVCEGERPERDGRNGSEEPPEAEMPRHSFREKRPKPRSLVRVNLRPLKANKNV